MIIPDNVTVYMNGRAYYAHVCGYHKDNERLSRLSLCFEGGVGVEVDRTDQPRREITVRAEIGGKTVNITYDPHDAEAVKAAEVWRNALFADGAQFKAVAPVAVKDGDSVAFVNPPCKETNGDKIRKADISVLSELLAAVKFGFWNSSYEIKSGVSVQHPEIFNRLNAYAGRIGRGDITCLDLIRAMTDNDLSEWLCLFRTREAEAWERLMGVLPDYSKPLIPESEREKFFFWLKKRPVTQDERRVTFVGEKPGGDERIEKAVQYTLRHLGALPTAAECEFIRKHPEVVKSNEPAEPIKARESLLGYEPLIGSNIDFADKIGYLWEESSSGRGYDLRWRDYPGGDANRVCNLYYNGVEGYYHVKALHEGNADISLKDCTIRALGIKQAMAEAEQLVRKHLQEAAAYSKTRLDKWKPANQATPKADLQQLDRAIRDLSGVIKDDRRGLHAYFDGVDMTYILECLKKYREMVGGAL